MDCLIEMWWIIDTFSIDMFLVNAVNNVKHRLRLPEPSDNTEWWAYSKGINMNLNSLNTWIQLNGIFQQSNPNLNMVADWHTYSAHALS